jgi:hypothetical protein
MGSSCARRPHAILKGVRPDKHSANARKGWVFIRSAQRLLRTLAKRTRVPLGRAFGAGCARSKAWLQLSCACLERSKAASLKPYPKQAALASQGAIAEPCTIFDGGAEGEG